VYAGLAIYDTIQLIDAPVSTIAVGLTASMGTVLLAAGTKGRRYALPNATIHMHQPLGGAQGQAAEIGAKLNKILAQATGQALERIERDTDRDFYLDAQGAKEYGIVDEVLTFEEERQNVS